jgi:hypothetical protein
MEQRRVGERRGRGASTTVRHQWPEAGGRRWHGQSGAMAADSRAPATAWGGAGREPAADAWAPTIVRAAGSAPFE